MIEQKKRRDTCAGHRCEPGAGGGEEAFQSRFPAVQRTEWKLKSDRNYEAEFTFKRTDIAVKFDTTGNWLETESAIPRASMKPKPGIKSAA